MATSRSGPATRQPTTGPADRYTERLLVPWWLWVIGFGLAGGAAAEIGLGAPGPRTWVPYAVLLPLAAVALAVASRITVGVVEGELRVDDARLPVRYVAQVGVLDASATRAALGPDADPYAFVVHRPWVRRAVLVVLDDPADPTPYWVISARRPDRLVAALQAGQAQAGQAQAVQAQAVQAQAVQARAGQAQAGQAQGAGAPAAGVGADPS